MKSEIIIQEQSKNEKIKMIEEFYRENGRLPKSNEQSPNGENIGRFLTNIKQGTTKITEDQLQILQHLGFSMKIMNAKEIVETKITMVEEFYRMNGRLPKWNEKSPEGENLGTFLTRIKQGKIKLTKEQIERLTILDVAFKTMSREEKNENKVKMVESFFEENGRLPKFFEKSPTGENLGNFLYRIQKRKIKLTETQLQRLKYLGFHPETINVEERTEAKIEIIEEFYKEHRRLPKWREKSSEGENIGTFLSNIKRGNTTITEDQLQRLEHLGFTFKTQKIISKEDNIQLIEKFYQENGRLPKYDEKSPEGENIGIFLNKIQQGTTKIKKHQLERLEQLGFTRSPNIPTKKIEQKIIMIETFFEVYGRLPKFFEKSPEGENLGIFLSNIKQGNTRITKDQLHRLEVLGFTMEVISHAEKTKSKIKMIEEFYKEYGRLPKAHEKSPTGESIGMFLSSIKQGKIKITEAQLQILEQMGFIRTPKKQMNKEDKIRLIENFYKEYKRLPKFKEQSPEGENIGTFLSSIKQGHVKITKEQKERLGCMGVDSDKIVIENNDRKRQLEELKQLKESLLEEHKETIKVYRK